MFPKEFREVIKKMQQRDNFFNMQSSMVQRSWFNFIKYW